MAMVINWSEHKFPYHIDHRVCMEITDFGPAQNWFSTDVEQVC